MFSVGPQTAEADRLHAMKYRKAKESFEESANRRAFALSDGPEHYHQFREVILTQRFCEGGRIQGAAGASRKTTMYNCFVSGTVLDELGSEGSTAAILDILKEAGITSKLGGGIGFDFSTLRPFGEPVRQIESYATGPVSFMEYFHSVAKGVASAGHRRGALMGCLRIDHPDIERFIDAKRGTLEQEAIRAAAQSLPKPERMAIEEALQAFNPLTSFNISVTVTDKFMECLAANRPFPLRFKETVFREIDPRELWEKLMRSTYEWAEPGVLFIDTINRLNPLSYCETIAATNPCGEQPLPPYGACLLGSFNLVKYLKPNGNNKWYFDYDLFKRDIPIVVRAMDNVVDRSLYPLSQQRNEALSKRRMGLGVMGLANCVEAHGFPYGSSMALHVQEKILQTLLFECYRAGAELAEEKGSFPLFDADRYLATEFISKRLPDEIKDLIRMKGLRNSHYTSIAPTGTISMAADNVSGGVEPVIFHEQQRKINSPNGPIEVVLQDWAVANLGIRGKLSHEVTADEHVATLLTAQKWVDSAVSKTINMDGHKMNWEQFQDIYFNVYNGGGKGCTTFNASGKRMALITSGPAERDDGPTCEWDPTTGTRSCE